MKTFLHGLALANYRGIGQELQKIGPFQNINFFIGPNNAGKSTILNFIATHLKAVGKKSPFERNTWARNFIDLDANQGKHPSQIFYGFAVRSNSHPIRSDENEEKGRIGAKLLDFLAQDSLLWLFPDSEFSGLGFERTDTNTIKQALSRPEWQYLWQTITNKSGGGLDEHWIPQSVFALAAAANVEFPEVKMIPAIREIGEKNAGFEDFTGKGLIDKLAELQNPPHDQRMLEKKFSQINQFLRSCTEVDDARIEIPYDRRYILVHMGNKVLPLASLGTGIHEVIMLASFCTLSDEMIICIEEPEIHLHPLMQRKLIRYLVENTNNQYFIATHSASLIDAAPAAIFNVTNEAGETRIRLVESPSDRHGICQQLGYRASDLLQSNAILWVEGPSDRIYLNHWIGHAASDLVEGIDYSIMFYGGRLLSHLSANDPEIDDFISLRRLNRNLAILIDSDLESESDEINQTKQRLVRELEDGYAWVTEGREIENYIDPARIETAVADIYGDKFGGMVSAGKFDSTLKFKRKDKDGKIEVADKIKIAKSICQEAPDFSVLDLQSRIDALVEFIRESNHPK